jgi:hypothetical protein
MDIVGYTTYRRAAGADYPVFCLETDMAQCAAELEGKESWCIELDSRTWIPHDVFNKNTYAMLGSGLKGIVYYQWRGDCPAEGVPNPNSCGLLNYDGSKTSNFDNAVRAVAKINELSELLVGAHRLHEGVGLLHSDFAAFLSDARENSDGQLMEDGIRNSYVSDQLELYRRLRKCGFRVTLTDAAHLKENPLGIRVLLVPRVGSLSERELDAVRAFAEAGGRVYTNLYADGYAGGISLAPYPPLDMTRKERVYENTYSVEDVAYMCGLSPAVSVLSGDIDTQMLVGDGYRLLIVNSISAAKACVGGTLWLKDAPVTVELHTFDGRGTVSHAGHEITLGELTDGAVLILR